MFDRTGAAPGQRSSIRDQTQGACTLFRDHGLVNFDVDAENEQILRAAILGSRGHEEIHCVQDVMYAKVPYTFPQKAVHIHPTSSELIPTIQGELKPL